MQCSCSLIIYDGIKVAHQNRKVYTNIPLLTLSFTSISAPASSRALTMSVWPHWAAYQRGVTLYCYEYNNQKKYIIKRYDQQHCVSYTFWSCLVLSYLILYYHIISYPIISCHVIPYHQSNHIESSSSIM